jgi:hypothetical protein
LTIGDVLLQLLNNGLLLVIDVLLQLLNVLLQLLNGLLLDLNGPLPVIDGLLAFSNVQLERIKFHDVRIGEVGIFAVVSETRK